MVNVFILVSHLVFVVYIFTKKTNEESMSTGLTHLALILILFTVGWSVISLFLNIFIEPEGFGKDFDRSTITLSLLSIIEMFFYKSYYKDIFSRRGAEDV